MDDRTVDLIFAGSLESLPPVSSKIVRIFTSSTFTGTQIEFVIFVASKLVLLLSLWYELVHSNLINNRHISAIFLIYENVSYGNVLSYGS